MKLILEAIEALTERWIVGAQIVTDDRRTKIYAVITKIIRPTPNTIRFELENLSSGPARQRAEEWLIKDNLGYLKIDLRKVESIIKCGKSILVKVKLSDGITNYYFNRPLIDEDWDVTLVA